MSGRITAIVCAAGTGSRAGFDRNKLLVPLLGVSILERSITAFCGTADEIVVAANPRDFEAVAPLAEKYDAILCEGGNTRTLSVYNALKKASGEIVLIHDGARPFVDADSIKTCVESVKKYGSGVCAVPVVDTLASTSEDEILSYPVRSKTYALQTPQGFYKAELLAAYERAIQNGETDFTDDSSLFHRYVRKPRICRGDWKNTKLTHREDFKVSASRVGFGVDTHAFGKAQDYVVLGGVRIPSESGLVAHSDGDVLVHALMDALLSAAGLKDIGHYFPDTDEKWKNADSVDMLKTVVELLKENGFVAANASIAVQAEKPRLAKYIDDIRQNLAAVLNLPLSAVGVSAGTNEKLGYVGEGKGITVYATTLLNSVRDQTL